MCSIKPPKATGNWSDDCTAGRDYATAIVAETEKFQDPLALLSAMAAMNGTQLNGVQVGFLQTIAEQLLVLSDASG